MPRFSIILVDFQGATPDPILLRGVDCILAQTYKDFELLCYHNGPLLDESIVQPLKERGVEFRCMDKNYNDWGFESRSRGIREASGDYIIHFNSDNYLIPTALEAVSKAIDACNNPPMLTFQIFTTTRGTRHLLTGNPPVVHNVDALQAVVKRQIWLENGGWVERTQTSDGEQLERFARKHGFVAINLILGEHH
jgi:glycosyltransferase involved in cell wall biosynthesis